MSVHGGAGGDFRPQLTEPAGGAYAHTGAGCSAARAAVGQRREREESSYQRLRDIKDFLASAGFAEDELEGDEAEVRGYVRALKRQGR